MEKIIIAVDHNEQTGEIVEIGIKLAKQINASIELLTVIDKELSFIVTTGFTFDNQLEERLFYSNTELKKIKDKYPEVQIDIVTFIGEPKEDIVKEIGQKKPSFTIIGTHGRSAFEQFVIGGTAEHIVRHSTYPVIVVPYNKEEH